MTVVHCKKEAYDVYIGRPSKYHNPFVIGKDGTREEVILKFHEYALRTFGEEQIVRDLEGKVLGCWCAPKPCHGHSLESIINSYRIGFGE